MRALRFSLRRSHPPESARAPTQAPDGAQLPIPPPEMRALVGPTDAAAFDNPSGALVYPYLTPDAFRHVFDFGCGCGRIARQLIQQNPRPQSYVGIDLHRGMIKWCSEYLAPSAPGFEFHHHDVFNPGLNPDSSKPSFAPFPAADGTFTLVNAWSVFTHVLEQSATLYLRECRRILADDGILHSTWFLFDKRDFPMMQEFQNALFINAADPTNAVIFDKGWLGRKAAEVDLSIYKVVPPYVRGFQWTVLMTPRRPSVVDVEFPEDTAPIGISRPPVTSTDPSTIGLAEE